MRPIDADHFLASLEKVVTSDKADPAWRQIAKTVQYMVDVEAFYFTLVKTGEWKERGDGYYLCSCCKKATKIPRYVGGFLYDYCPHCGADMRDEE